MGEGSISCCNEQEKERVGENETLLVKKSPIHGNGQASR